MTAALCCDDSANEALLRRCASHRPNLPRARPQTREEMPRVRAKVARVVTQIFSMFDSQATDVLNPVEGDYPLKKMTGPEMGKAVLYYTQIDGQIFISALSNAGDEATLDLMTGVNKEALARLVAEDPTIGQETIGDAAEEKSDGCVQKGAAKFCSANN